MVGVVEKKAGGMSDVDRCGENNEVIAGRWSEIRWFQCGYVNLPTARSQTISEGPPKYDLKAVVPGRMHDQCAPGFPIARKCTASRVRSVY